MQRAQVLRRCYFSSCSSASDDDESLAICFLVPAGLASFFAAHVIFKGVLTGGALARAFAAVFLVFTLSWSGADGTCSSSSAVTTGASISSSVSPSFGDTGEGGLLGVFPVIRRFFEGDP